MNIINAIVRLFKGLLRNAALAALLLTACLFLYCTVVLQRPNNLPEAEPIDGVLLLPDGFGQLTSEEPIIVRSGSVQCSALKLVYTFSNNLQVQVITATPVNYSSFLADELWSLQMDTDFTLAGLDALHYTGTNAQRLLFAASGDTAYFILAPTDVQSLHLLGERACIDETRRLTAP